MNPEVGSIMSYFYKLFPVKVYTKEVPINFDTPSLYFPPPFSFDSNDTNTGFIKSYNLTVKLFHKDSQQAYSEAERIADAVNSVKNVIPMVGSEDGLPTGEYVRLTGIETRIGDSGVATLVLTWDSGYMYEKETWPSLEHIEFNSEVR